MEFEVGDRVVIVGMAEEGSLRYDYLNPDLEIGDAGVMVGIPDRWGYEYAVRFDREIINGHDCDGKCDRGFGWFIRSDEYILEKEDDNIVPPTPEEILRFLMTTSEAEE